MPSQKSCPLKFGTAVNPEGMIIEIPCSGNDCEWFFENNCAITCIAKELSTNRKKRGQKRLDAD
jgi:hypothetical protein